MFGCIWIHFVTAFKLDAKWAELVQLMQKFMPRSCVGICCNKCTRSTPLDPKLKFWCVSYYLGAFGTILLPYETRCKTDRIGAKVRASKFYHNFSQQTHPIHPIGQKAHVFFVFRSVWVHFGPFCYSMKLDAKWAKLVQLLQKFMP